MARDQGIAKAGNGRARKAMIELAWLWRRHQPDSALSSGSVNASATGRAASSASPSSPWRASWRRPLRYLETGLLPEGAVLKRA